MLLNPLEAAFIDFLESRSCSAVYLLWAHTGWAAVQLMKSLPRKDLLVPMWLVHLKGFVYCHISQLYMLALHCGQGAQRLTYPQFRTVNSTCSSLLVALLSWEPSEQVVSWMNYPDGGGSIHIEVMQPCYARSGQTFSICSQVRCQEILRLFWNSFSSMQLVPFPNGLWQAGR